jgi:MazG family protein
VSDAAGVVAQWHELKKAEKPERQSALDGVPRALPALMRAEALQQKARRVGFDWPDVRGSLDKVREEVAEVTAEIESDLAFAQANEAKFTPAPATAEEIGDLLFSIVNLTRHLKLDAEELLTGANDKFSRRFRAVEARIRAQGGKLTDCTLEELDAAWNAVKSEGLSARRDDPNNAAAS